jgi:hypothetical protein
MYNFFSRTKRYNVYKPLNNDKNKFSIAMYKVPKNEILNNFWPLIKHERE